MVAQEGQIQLECLFSQALLWGCICLWATDLTSLNSVSSSAKWGTLLYECCEDSGR